QWPSVEDTLRDFLTDSEKFRADRASLVRVADVQRRITDPTKHASLSIDCLSCHATGAVGGYVGRELTSREQAERKEPEFKNPGSYDLSNMSVRPGSPIRFRAFGYEGREVGILDRVIFESALVAEALKRAP